MQIKRFSNHSSNHLIRIESDVMLPILLSRHTSQNDAHIFPTPSSHLWIDSCCHSRLHFNSIWHVYTVCYCALHKQHPYTLQHHFKPHSFFSIRCVLLKITMSHFQWHCRNRHNSCLHLNHFKMMSFICLDLCWSDSRTAQLKRTFRKKKSNQMYAGDV